MGLESFLCLLFISTHLQKALVSPDKEVCVMNGTWIRQEGMKEGGIERAWFLSSSLHQCTKGGLSDD